MENRIPPLGYRSRYPAQQMKFSLSTLMTVTALTAWAITIFQMPNVNREPFVVGTFLLSSIAFFLIAMSRERNRS